MTRWYVYALVDQRMSKQRVSGHTIESVPAGRAFALAERTDAAPALSQEALLDQHAVVTELAKRAAAILPARFGSLVDDEELQRVVRLQGQRVREAFDLVRGCEQMTVRLSGPAERSEVTAEPVVASSPGLRYLKQRRAAAGYPLPDVVKRLSAALASIVKAERSEPGQGDVRAMMHHLIRRGNRRAYVRAIAAVAAGLSPYTVKVTGPFPPFAFVPELLP